MGMDVASGCRGSALLTSTLGAHRDDSFVDWLRARGGHRGERERQCGGRGHRQTVLWLAPALTGSETGRHAGAHLPAILSFPTCRVG